MADMPSIDPDFEPQSRPRSCTWPMKRPNLGNDSANENDVAMKLEPTIEEDGSEELHDGVISSNITLPEMKHESDDHVLMSGTFSNDFGNGFIKSPTASCVTDYNGGLTPPPSLSTVTAADISSNNPSYINLDSAPQSLPIPLTNYGAVNLPGTTTINTLDSKPIYPQKGVTSPGPLPSYSMSSSGDSTCTTSPTVSKPKSSSRKNAWGNMSYADLITQGIESSPDKRLTLAQIYDWMVKNVPYFKDKGDSNSSAGWKNSIRHNLSLHAKFKRIQNEGTGKSSWWVINHDAKPGKPNRRRTTSLDTSNPKFKQSRAKALLKKSDLTKKQKNCSKKDTPPTWAKSGTLMDGPIDYEHPFNKPLLSDYRPRTSSNASSIGGRITPPRNLLTQDLEDDGPPPLSPLSSSSFAAAPSALDPLGRADPFGLDPMQGTGELFEGINIDMVTSSPMSQSNKDKTSIYLNSTQSGAAPSSFTCSSPHFMQQMNGINVSSQVPTAVNVTANQSKSVLSSPNLASLLQQGNGSQQSKFQAMAAKPNKRLPSADINNIVPRARANTMPKLQPQPKYNMAESSLRRQQSGESLMQGSFFTSYQAPENQQQLPSPPESTYMQYRYGHNQANQSRHQVQEGFSSLTNQNKTLVQLLGPPRSDDVITSSQSQQLNLNHTNSMSATKQRNCEVSVQHPNYTAITQQNSTGDVKSLNSLPKYPSDLSTIDNQDMFDPGAGTFDIEEMLQDIRSPGIDRFGTEFNSYFPQGSFEVSEVDNSMDATNTLPSSAVSNGSAFNFPNDSAFVTQPRHTQPVHMYSLDESRGAQFLLGPNTPSSGSMLIARSGPAVGISSNGLPSHFAHSHQMMRPQSSVGAISDYRM